MTLPSTKTPFAPDELLLQYVLLWWANRNQKRSIIRSPITEIDNFGGAFFFSFQLLVLGFQLKETLCHFKHNHEEKSYV